MWSIFLKYVSSYLILLYIYPASSQNLNDTKILHDDLFQDYNKGIRPIDKQVDALSITVSYHFERLVDIDEVQESMTSIALLAMKWTDDSLKWNLTAYNGIKFTFVPKSHIWKPDLILANAALKIAEMGLPAYYVGINYDGLIHWDVFDIYTRCSLDLIYYPFDTQKCTIELKVWSYSQAEIRLTSLFFNSDVNGNSIWTVNSVSDISPRGRDTTTLTYKITSQRKASFFVLNTLIPIATLGVIGTFVFVIPADAGEKIGFSTTIFLSFAVFLTVISSDPPSSSDTVVIVNIYIMIENFLSALMITTLQTRLRHRSDPKVAIFYRGVVRISHSLQCMSNKIASGKTVNEFSEREDTDFYSWVSVTNAIDVLCFASFFLLQIIIHVGFMGYLMTA